MAETTANLARGRVRHGPSACRSGAVPYFTGARREAVYALLFEALALLRGAGLKVIVDIHPNSRHPVWGQDAVASGMHTEAFQAVAGVIESFGARLSPSDRSWVALELLNEPRLKCQGEQQDLWQAMAGDLVRRARAASPLLTLVVSGACVSSIDGLLALDPSSFHDDNIVYTFHFYEPFSFTHQGAQFIPWPDKYLDGVPWPVSARPIGEPLALMNRLIDGMSGLDAAARETARRGARHNLERLYTAGAGRETIEARFAQLADWARRYGIRPSAVFNGEFGVMRRAQGKPGAFCGDRLAWLRDVRLASEKYGFPWAYFSYDGPLALVLDDDERLLDAGVLAALGLHSNCGSFCRPDCALPGHSRSK
ncbi:MAG: glycoside hydrolase family 5 protein [Rhodomicrobium sp.]|nr:glycoside hydrolase family 5 protein [Rhodomicrobium sp.]